MIDPDAMTTMSAVSRAAARRAPNRICNRFEGRDTSFAAFDRHADQVARGLDAAGAKVAAYLGKNGDHAFEVYVGATRAGGIFAPLNWRLAPAEIVEILRRYPPDILFVGPEFHGAAERILSELPAIPVIAMEGGHPDWPAYEAWRDARSEEPFEDRSAPDDPALALFTSGTTGLPKAALLSHRNLLRQRVDTLPRRLAYDHWDEGDVSLMAMPLAHIGGIGWWNLGLCNVCTNVIAREFNPAQVLDFVEKDGISKMFMVPAALQIVVQDPRARTIDFSRIKHIMYGAAPMPLPLLQEAIEVIGCQFAQCYGMTETTGTIAMLMPEDHVPEGSPRMRAAGRAMPGSEIAVFGPDGAPVPVGEIGEVAIRSPCNMLRYWNNAEATEKTLRGDGWLLSGDAGYMDEDGYLFIHDRIKDMIITGGENVYPAEVESALHGHPAIREAAVIGVPDPKWGEAVKAVVTARPGARIDPAEVIDWMHGRLAAFKVPKSVDVIEVMPRNASGKLLKRDLRAPYWEGRDRQVN